MESGKIEVFLIDLVLSECIWVLEKFYKVPRQQIFQKLHIFLHVKGVLTETPKSVLDKAFSIWNETSLDWTDALLVAKTLHKNTRLITFDREIEKNFPNAKFPF